MLMGTHMVAGGLIYRASSNYPNWVKWPIVIVGGFLSHFVLDSVITYHGLPMDKELSLALVAAQLFGVFVLWYTSASKAKAYWQIGLPPELMAGLWAWLCWDWEWIAPKQYLHLIACDTWAPRYFSTYSPNAWTSLWEVGIIMVMVFLVSGLLVKKPQTVENGE